MNSFIIFLLGVYGAKKIDLSKNGAFSWQGLGAAQYLVVFPLMIGPVLVYLPFYIFEQPNFGLMALAAMGLMGLVFHKSILEKLAARLNARKYKMAAAFREA